MSVFLFFVFLKPQCDRKWSSPRPKRKQPLGFGFIILCLLLSFRAEFGLVQLLNSSFPSEEFGQKARKEILHSVIESKVKEQPKVWVKWDTGHMGFDSKTITG